MNKTNTNTTQSSLITLEWVLDFTGLEYSNTHEFEVEDGVLEVEVRHLEQDGLEVDFIMEMEATVYEDRDGPYRHARIHFQLPLPECITSNGKADFIALCDAAAGPEEIVFWDERLAVERQQRIEAINEKNMREWKESFEWQEAFFESHRRTLSAAGDM